MKIKKEDNDEEYFIPGFQGDHRIDLIRKLVTDNLGYLADIDGTNTNGKIQYSIDSGTIRGFETVKEKWLKKSPQNPSQQKMNCAKSSPKSKSPTAMTLEAPPFSTNLLKKNFSQCGQE